MEERHKSGLVRYRRIALVSRGAVTSPVESVGPVVAIMDDGCVVGVFA